MRDHTKLRAFELADALALRVYESTRGFSSEERFGLSAQMQRAAVSIACNIVAGAARQTEAEYVRFLAVAYGSARELVYRASLAARLGYLTPDQSELLNGACVETSQVLNGLIRAIRG